MSSFKTKLLGTILILMLLIFVPFIVLAANEQLQIVSTENGDYLIYVQNLTEEFKYALSTNKDENVATLDFISSVPDDDGNQVVLITNEKYEEIKDENVYIWIENSENQMIINAEQLDFSLAFAKEKMNIVENTTKRILVDTTKTLTSVEDIEGVKTTVTTGAIEITDSKDATYYYMSVKLPADEKYNRLMELSETINQNYNDMDMYSRIQTANEFYNLYNELISNVQWQEVENMTIAQPEDSKLRAGDGRRRGKAQARRGGPVRGLGLPIADYASCPKKRTKKAGKFPRFFFARGCMLACNFCPDSGYR